MNRPPCSRLLAATWATIVAGIAMLAVLSQCVERTPDELNYQLAGRTLVSRQPLAHVEERFQGPLILLGTQLTDGGGAAAKAEPLLRARLGMLVFPALLLVVVAAWTRQALGERAALLATFLVATSPTLLAYGPLLSSDVPFTATGLLAAWTTWRWLQTPTTARLLACGAALGALAATKYTAALTIAALAAAVVAAPFTGFDPWPSRSGAMRRLRVRVALTLAAIAAAGAVALAVLYAAYLFASPPFAAASVEQLTTAPMRAFAALPLGTTLLSLLPEPMVLGIDCQVAWAGRAQNGTFLDQRGSHWAYYPMTVLLKTPLPVLLLAVGGALAGRAVPRSRGWWTCAVLPPLLLLAYCSVTRSLQMGMRYVLPVVPALSMLAGGAACRPWAATRAGRLAIGALAVWSVANVAIGWPHFVGFFNALAGGSTNGYRVCADGNLDWDQRRVSGEAALRARHPGVHVLQPGEGPRFARVAAYAEELKADDPRTPGRLYHWLARFRPIDHDGAAWLVFDVTPEAFARAVAAGDHRAAEDLCRAHLLRGDFAAARSALALVPAASRDGTHAATAALVERMAAAGDAAQRDAIAPQLMAAGWFELALAWTDRGARQNAVRTALLLALVGRQREGVAFLEAAGADGSRTTAEVILLARSLVDGGRNYAPDPMHALELMRRGPAPAPESPLHGEWQTVAQQVAQAIERERRVAGDR